MGFGIVACYWQICAIERLRCADGRSLVGATSDMS